MRFEFIEPFTIQEAISSLVAHAGKVKVVAGGTDLLVQMRQKTLTPEYVVDVTNIPGLDYIRYDKKEGMKIGALTTISAIEGSAELLEKYPVVAKAAGHLGSPAIRNLGTLGGNLCNASPSAEMPPTLIGLSARAKIVGPEGERSVLLEEFFTGPGKTVLKNGELLTEIQLPVPSPNTKGAYFRHAIRHSHDLSIVNVAIIVDVEPRKKICKDVKIVLGAVAPTPIRARNAENALRGKKLAEDLIQEIADLASSEAKPITDVRATAWYRKEMVMVYTRRALNKIKANSPEMF
jgi:aerobic carbon-monoxide dehydrogenase medium subunit